MKLRCGGCGSRNVSLQNAKGKGFPYKSYPEVIIKVDIDLHTCLDCDSIMLVPGDSERMDEAIEKTLRMENQNDQDK